MTESDIQQLLSGQPSGTGTSPLNQILEPLMPILSLLTAISIGLSIIVVIYFIVNIIQKQRQHHAIIRIDKNLQKLVDAQVPVEKSSEQ